MGNHKVMKAYIYGLIDPRDGIVKYVGKTVNISKRMSAHRLGHGTKTSKKACWIKHLKSKGLEIDYVILEECGESDWKDREIKWIKHFKDLGIKLKNGTDGGDGGFTGSFSEEARQKIAKATGHPATLYDLNGNTLGIYDSISAAAREIGVQANTAGCHVKNNSKPLKGKYIIKTK